MKLKKVLLGIFFFVWQRYIYSELQKLVQKTETLIDDTALEAVDQALEILESELGN
jgi:ElaB/YqjD/DUF883 family membrane-anchored ribosome-binding protein